MMAKKTAFALKHKYSNIEHSKLYTEQSLQDVDCLQETVFHLTSYWICRCVFDTLDLGIK